MRRNPGGQLGQRLHDDDEEEMRSRHAGDWDRTLVRLSGGSSPAVHLLCLSVSLNMCDSLRDNDSLPALISLFFGNPQIDALIS